MRTPYVAAALLALAGCTAPPPPAPPDPAEKPAKETVVARPLKPPAPPPRPAVRPKPKPKIARAPTPAPPPPPIDDDPKRLFGMGGHGVAALLGPANYVRREGPAEVWQYRAEACVLDVYLYKDNGMLAVAHVDLRARPNAALPPRRCFRGLLAKSG